MEQRPFSDINNKPAEIGLKKTLGITYPFFKSLLELSSDFRQEWNYSKLSGWMLKISDNKKALFYVIPLAQSVRVSFTVRENEKEILVKDKELNELSEMLKSAKKYSEGYAVQINITDIESHKTAAKLISKIIELRN